MIGAEIVLVFKMVFAIIVGGIVGIEREIRREPAGLRTHILICVGAALAVSLVYTFIQLGDSTARIVTGIMTGMGFIGAGTIMKCSHGDKGCGIKGLTTAASLWVVAALGMTVGMELYFLSLSAALLIVFVLRLKKVERKLERKVKKYSLKIWNAVF